MSFFLSFFYFVPNETNTKVSCVFTTDDWTVIVLLKHALRNVNDKARSMPTVDIEVNGFSGFCSEIQFIFNIFCTRLKFITIFFLQIVGFLYISTYEFVTPIGSNKNFQTKFSIYINKSGKTIK